MSYKYTPFGHDGCSCICDDGPERDPDVICDLCGEVCTEDFHLVEQSHSLSIIVCGDCMSQDKRDLDEIIEYWMSYNQR